MNAIRPSLPGTSTRPASQRSPGSSELRDIRSSKSLDKPSSRLAQHSAKGSAVSVEIDFQGQRSSGEGYVNHTLEARTPLPNGNKGHVSPTPGASPTPGGGSSSGASIDVEA